MNDANLPSSLNHHTSDLDLDNKMMRSQCQGINCHQPNLNHPETKSRKRTVTNVSMVTIILLLFVPFGDSIRTTNSGTHSWSDYVPSRHQVSSGRASLFPFVPSSSQSLSSPPSSSSPFHFIAESSNHSYSYLPPLELQQRSSSPSVLVVKGSRPPTLSSSQLLLPSSSILLPSRSTPPRYPSLIQSPLTREEEVIVVSSKKRIPVTKDGGNRGFNYNTNKKQPNYNQWNKNQRTNINNVIYAASSSVSNKKRSSNRKTSNSFNPGTKDVHKGVQDTKSKDNGSPFRPPLPPPRPASRKPRPQNKMPPPPSEQPPRSNPSPSESSPEATTVIKPEPLTKQCLSCICNANTNCDESIKCVLNEFCGPYLISNKYWIEAGKLGTDYRSCVFNKTCAEETVTNYMAKYATDCNGDQYIDCDDYVALHQLGPSGCKSLSPQISNTISRTSAPVTKSSSSAFYSSNYWNFYQYCYNLSPLARREYPAIETPDEIDPRLFVADTPNGSGSRRSKQPGLVVPKFTVRPITPSPPPSLQSTTATSTTESPLNDVFNVPSECLDCLCEANGCSKNVTCSDALNGDYMNTGCGPFMVSYKYWLDSGREPDRITFQSCAADKACARGIVTTYVNKFATDCNNDGYVDCADYVLVHKLGYKYCRSLSATNMALTMAAQSPSFSSTLPSGLWVKDDPIYDTKYWKKFQKCYGFGKK